VYLQPPFFACFMARATDDLSSMVLQSFGTVFEKKKDKTPVQIIVQVKAMSNMVTNLGIQRSWLLPQGLFETIVRETATLPDTHCMSPAQACRRKPACRSEY
jgi:hypothetical protein